MSSLQHRHRVLGSFNKTLKCSFWRVPRFIPAKQTTGCVFPSARLRVWRSWGRSGLRTLIVGTSNESSWDPAVIVPGIPGLARAETSNLRLWHLQSWNHLPGGAESSFWFVLDEKTHTRTRKWTVIKYCLCYLLFLRNTSIWWDLLKMRTLGQA